MHRVYSIDQDLSHLSILTNQKSRSTGHQQLLDLSVRLDRLHTGLACLVVLEALACSFVDGLLACNDLLDGCEDAAPVLEDGEGNVLARAVGDKVLREGQYKLHLG